MGNIPKFVIPFYLDYTLTEHVPEDRDAMVEHLKCQTISDNTTIPFPYSTADADWWINEKRNELAKNGQPVSFVIRDEKSKLIGAVAFDGVVLGTDKRAELGYWIAEEYWGKGLMTRAVIKACEIGFRELDLRKITAHVYTHNKGSRRVLEKAGFDQEGLLKAHIYKNNTMVDAYIYGLVKP